jgi:hypothetical protein
MAVQPTASFDLQAVLEEIKAEIGGLGAKIDTLGSELRGDIVDIRRDISELRGDIGKVAAGMDTSAGNLARVIAKHITLEISYRDHIRDTDWYHAGFGCLVASRDPAQQGAVYLLTAAKVIAGRLMRATEVLLSFARGSPVRFKGSDMAAFVLPALYVTEGVPDIGLVQLPPGLFKPTKMEDFGGIDIGQQLTGIGSPLVHVQGTVVRSYRNSFRLLADAISVPSNMGCPMVNDLGQVCAVVHVANHGGADYDGATPVAYLDRITPFQEDPPTTKWLLIMAENSQVKAFLRKNEYVFCGVDRVGKPLEALFHDRSKRLALGSWLEALNPLCKSDGEKTMTENLKQLVDRLLSEQTAPLDWVSKCQVVVEIEEDLTSHLPAEAVTIHNEAIHKYLRLRRESRHVSWQQCKDVSLALLAVRGRLVKTNVDERRTLDQYCVELDTALHTFQFQLGSTLVCAPSTGNNGEK